ncbi:unnamed protein product [Brassica rapa]|uniref:Knottin scorpion toxin-like domain-containing protein n=1 Tax=Brassica campestris TaxID=3711 RepID=A0A3P5ZU02_BRACM|nr:unnamed protein product [Brassica rapa]VDC83707.1 unnamed protein product [Brassica rapa]
MIITFFICVAFSIVEENSVGQKRCQKMIDAANFCQISNCRLHCYSQQNGVGKCFDDPKVPGKSNCGSPLLRRIY